MPPAPDPLAAPGRDETGERDRRLRLLLDRQGANGIVLGRRDGFAWATAGGNGKLQLTSERSVGLLVVTAEAKYLVAYEMDAERLATEQCPDQGFEVVALGWRDGDPGAHAVRLAGPGTVLSDVPLAGTRPVTLHDCHHPLTPLDRTRLRWLGGLVDRTIAEVAAGLRPGVSELRVAAELSARFVTEDADADELMVGFDDRVRRYRHFVAAGARLRRYALLHPTVSRWGLHAIVTRSVHLGSPPAELRRRFDACATIEAYSTAASQPGTTFRQIHEGRAARYRELGFPGEEQRHFQGGLTGYTLYDPAHVTRPDDAIADGMALDWFTTVPGAKTEETLLVTGAGPEVVTLTGAWPVRRQGAAGREREMADLLVLD